MGKSGSQAVKNVLLFKKIPGQRSLIGRRDFLNRVIGD
jgi:hypothetical protein